jgi:glycosyltransferase involved in cell wall biosynthesis
VASALEADPGVALRRRATDRPAPPAPLPHTADVEVRHAWPPDFRPPASGRLALIQPWEFGAIPQAWVAPLRATVDELWVPSEHVRGMYLDAGLDPGRVAVVPNGVDLETYRPQGPALDLPGSAGIRPGGIRLLFVGGAIARKGIDVLLAAYAEAFAGRDDVTLVVKDFGADGVYRNADRSALHAAAAAGAGGPRVIVLHDVLGDAQVPALYRACDVLVHPYRGEGFAMPVLEAMACGLPVITTAGGPTDEFCPPEAGWRIPSRRATLGRSISGMPTAGEAWMLEPDRDALVALLREAVAASPQERTRRGAAARAAAQDLGWDAVAARYASRLRALADRPPLLAAAPELDLGLDGTAPRILATPAFRGQDRLGELLAAWVDAAPAGTPGTLVLVADPAHDGDAAAAEAHILAAAASAGADLDGCADIEVRFLAAVPGRDEALHAATDAYVALHGACAGHARQARAAGHPVLEPDAVDLRSVLLRSAAVSAA